MTFRGILSVAAALALGAPLFAEDPIRPDQFEKLSKLIRPSAEESRWMDIPWETSLWEGRKKAAAEGKPIFLWSMDGNPLGTS